MRFNLTDNKIKEKWKFSGGWCFLWENKRNGSTLGRAAFLMKFILKQYEQKSATHIFITKICYRAIPTKRLTLEDINIFETEVQLMNKRQYLHSQNKENGTDHNRANQIKKCL